MNQDYKIIIFLLTHSMIQSNSELPNNLNVNYWRYIENYQQGINGIAHNSTQEKILAQQSEIWQKWDLCKIIPYTNPENPSIKTIELRRNIVTKYDLTFNNFNHIFTDPFFSENQAEVKAIIFFQALIISNFFMDVNKKGFESKNPVGFFPYQKYIFSLGMFFAWYTQPDLIFRHSSHEPSEWEKLEDELIDLIRNINKEKNRYAVSYNNLILDGLKNYENYLVKNKKGSKLQALIIVENFLEKLSRIEDFKQPYTKYNILLKIEFLRRGVIELIKTGIFLSIIYLLYKNKKIQNWLDRFKKFRFRANQP